MNPLDMPKSHDLGFGDLVELDYLVQLFGIKRPSAMKYLHALHIKPFFIGNEVYFSLVTFKRILFVLSRPNSPGFLFPGSERKYHRRMQDPEYLTEVTDEILEQAADPKILAEMSACGGRDQSIIRKFVTPPQGRPGRKEKKDESVS